MDECRAAGGPLFLLNLKNMKGRGRLKVHRQLKDLILNDFLPN